MNQQASRLLRIVGTFTKWVGEQSLIKDISSVVNLLSGEQQIRLLAAEANLFAPPNENLRNASEKYLLTPVDDVFYTLARELGLKVKPFWPRQAPYAFCLTHDVDRIYSTYQATARHLINGRIVLAAKAFLRDLRAESNSYNNLGRMCEYYKGWGIRGALYVLFEHPRLLRAILKREPQSFLGVYDPRSIESALRDLSNLGLEIGLHGSFDAPFSERHLAAETAKVRELISSDLGPYGYRSHYLQFALTTTPEYLANCRFIYDSSLGFNFMVGFRCGTCFPYVLTSGTNKLLELPLIAMDSALSIVARQTGKKLDDIIMPVYQRISTNGGVVMLNWHSQFCNGDAYPELYRLFDKLIQKAKHEGAFITTPVDLARHWLQRVGEPVCVID
jgi:hypothetical protein